MSPRKQPVTTNVVDEPLTSPTDLALSEASSQLSDLLNELRQAFFQGGAAAADALLQSSMSRLRDDPEWAATLRDAFGAVFMSSQSTHTLTEQENLTADALFEGVLLAAAGWLMGIIDNAVIFHRFGERVRAGKGLFRGLPEGWRVWMTAGMDKRAVALAGNAALGFMLGAARNVGILLGLPFDNGYIASGPSALIIWSEPELRTFDMVALLAFAMVSIGRINFLASFALTLQVAFAARGVEGIDWKRQQCQLWRLLRADPIAF